MVTRFPIPRPIVPLDLAAMRRMVPLDTSHYFPVQEQRDDGRSLEALLAEKVRTLATILERIQRDGEGRRTLSDSVQRRIAEHYRLVWTQLFALEHWPIGTRPDVDQRRQFLEQELDVLRHEERQELVESWRDGAQLQREWRSWFKQYADLVQRVQLVLPAWSQRKALAGPKSL